MKKEQIGIFINNPFVEYLVGICEEQVTEDNSEEKFIVFARNKNLGIEKIEPLKNIKVRMVKKFDLKEFKSTYKKELNAVNKFNKNNKLGLNHLQILQITYILNIIDDLSDSAISKEYEKLNLFYNSK